MTSDSGSGLKVNQGSDASGHAGWQLQEPICRSWYPWGQQCPEDVFVCAKEGVVGGWHVTASFFFFFPYKTWCLRFLKRGGTENARSTTLRRKSVYTPPIGLLTSQVTRCSLVRSSNSLPSWHSTQTCSGSMRHTQEVYQDTRGLTKGSETCGEGMPAEQ